MSVVALNDRLLAAAGSSWDGWTRVDVAALADPDPHLVDEGRHALAEDYEREDLIVLKDPRLCRLLPFWLRVFDAESIEVVAVLPIRHPAEVAASLQARNGIPQAIGRLVWLRHVLEAERCSRGLRRFHCRYDDLLRDWSGLVARAERQLGLVFAPRTETAATAIGQFLRPGLRHHSGTARFASRTGWFETVHAVLSRWADAGEDPSDHLTLDAVRARFDAAEPALGDLTGTAGSDPVDPDCDPRPIGDGSDEVAVLQALLAEYERKLERVERDNAWLRSAALAALGPDCKGALAWIGRRGLVRRLWLKELMRPGIFDPKAYLDANPDVARAGVDPLRHYLRYGLQEVRPRKPKVEP